MTASEARSPYWTGSDERPCSLAERPPDYKDKKLVESARAGLLMTGEKTVCKESSALRAVLGGTPSPRIRMVGPSRIVNMPPHAAA